MKILVSEMPKKKEECLYHNRINKMHKIDEGWCSINNKPCSFKNGESIFGGECRCLELGSRYIGF
jgi:hypothetical protein